MPFTFACRISKPLLCFGCNFLCLYLQVLVYESGAVEIHKLSGLFSSASGDELDAFASFLDRVIWKHTHPTHNKWANWFDFQVVSKNIFPVAIHIENHNARLWSIGVNFKSTDVLKLSSVDHMSNLKRNICFNFWLFLTFSDSQQIVPSNWQTYTSDNTSSQTQKCLFLWLV